MMMVGGVVGGALKWEDDGSGWGCGVVMDGGGWWVEW